MYIQLRVTPKALPDRSTDKQGLTVDIFYSVERYFSLATVYNRKTSLTLYLNILPIHEKAKIKPK